MTANTITITRAVACRLVNDLVARKGSKPLIIDAISEIVVALDEAQGETRPNAPASIVITVMPDHVTVIGEDE